MIESTPETESITLTQSQREQLARLVHDDIMQALAACSLATDLGARFCREGRTQDALEELALIRSGLDLGVLKLRDLLAELRVSS
jgi:signal transduction histidine kinase